MTRDEWLSSKDPLAMLKCLQGQEVSPTSERKLRLFACAFQRAVWQYVTNREVIHSLGHEEMYADGLVGLSDLESAYRDIVAIVSWYQKLLLHDRVKLVQVATLRDIVGDPFMPVKLPIHKQTFDPPLTDSYWPTKIVAEYRCRWLTPQVLSLTHGAYDERLDDGTLDPFRLTLLSDALEEAGCTDEAILTHLRSPGPHYRGCWAADLILGRG